MKVVLYSALYGDYEHPKKVPEDLGVPAIMYTDNPDLHAPGWQVRVRPDPWLEVHDADPAATKPMMDHKFWKLHPHLVGKDIDVSIWMDASMEIVAPNFVQLCLDALGDDDLVTVAHPARSCIYPEAAFSAALQRYDAAAITKQADFYRVFHPPNWGLFATGARVSRHTPRMKKFFQDWWWECTTRSHQDQISFPVLLRLADDVKWNTTMPWFQWWHLYEHGM